MDDDDVVVVVHCPYPTSNIFLEVIPSKSYVINRTEPLDFLDIYYQLGNQPRKHTFPILSSIISLPLHPTQQWNTMKLWKFIVLFHLITLYPYVFLSLLSTPSTDTAPPPVRSCSRSFGRSTLLPSRHH